MEIIKTIADMEQFAAAHAAEGIGFVPTMGALHEGHLSLIQRSVKENAVTVVSVFVNPTQFCPGEDYEAYPRTLDADAALAAEAGAAAIFAPSAQEMYPEGYDTYVETGGITDALCGKSRPGHFRGVTTVLTKLFHLVQPQRAYFGQKDAQQLLVVQKMVRELNFDLEIVGCPIVREPDGLAKSSRNQYLSADERQRAVVLSRSLTHTRVKIAAGETNAAKLIADMHGMITAKGGEVEYIEYVSRKTLQPLNTVQPDSMFALAVRFGTTRLIDNLFID